MMLSILELVSTHIVSYRQIITQLKVFYTNIYLIYTYVECIKYILPWVVISLYSTIYFKLKNYLWKQKYLYLCALNYQICWKERQIKYKYG